MTTGELQKSATGVSLREVMRLDEDAWVEVVDGKLEANTVSPGYLHILIIEALYDLLKPFVKKHDLGRVHTDGLMYLLHVDEDKVRYARIPDFSFIRKAGIPADFDITRPFPGAPTLAVEVVSPGENNATLQGKVRDYLTYGTEAVWAVYPQSRTVAVYVELVEEAQGNNKTEAPPPALFTGDDPLPTTPFFPGVTITVADLFTGVEQA